MNEAVPAGLVPPRPNLGPEPWQDPRRSTLDYPAILAVVLLLAAALLWRAYRRKAARARRKPSASGALAEADPSPRDRLVALSGSLREAMTIPLGNICRSKTTEELAADGRLEELLGDEGLRELIRFLDQIDRLKFAPERSEHQQDVLAEALTSWEPRVEALRARIDARPARGRGRAGGPASKSSNQSTRRPVEDRRTEPAPTRDRPVISS